LSAPPDLLAVIWGEGWLLLREREGKEWEKGRKRMGRGKGGREGERGKGRGGEGGLTMYAFP